MLVFVTQNPHKFAEASAIGRERGIRLLQHDRPSVEIQSANVEEIVRAKALAAYALLGRPLFVEHTSLHLHWVDGFPAGFTSAFMRSFGDDRICAVFGEDGRCAATGRTTIGHHDGRRVRIFSGEISGRIVRTPAGGSGAWEGFGWNRVFAPEGESRTFSELGVDEKNKISMRRTALLQLLDHLAAP